MSHGAWRPWRVAWHEALYGRDGFYRRPEGPAGHFRTAAHASSRGLLGAAVARLARALGCRAVLDVGAGRGELVRAVHAADARLVVTGVDVVPRPPGLPADVRWEQRAVAPQEPTLLVAWELLDVVPVPVLEVDQSGAARLVEVDADGTERLGGLASEDDLTWCDRWWPLDGPAARAEVGRPRDEAWASLVDALVPAGGVALAVDYGHDRGSRPPGGSLTGYLRGRRVPAVPDGSCDITAHVALDSVAAVRPGALRLTQREALEALGVRPPRPPHALATRDPAGYVRALASCGEAAELLDPEGLGAFGWLLNPVGDPLAARLAGAFSAGGPAPAPSSAPDRRPPARGGPAPPAR